MADLQTSINELKKHKVELLKLVSQGELPGSAIDGENRDSVAAYERAERGAQGFTPLVLKPKTAEQVQALINYAKENGLHFVINAAWTGLVEAGIPKGEIVLNLADMNRIRSIEIKLNNGEQKTLNLKSTDADELAKELAAWKESQKIDNKDIVGVVLDVEAGVSIATANEMLKVLNWEIPIGVGDTRATICGCIANGAAGDKLVSAEMNPNSISNDVIETSVGLVTSINGVFGNGEIVEGEVPEKEQPSAKGALRINSGVFKKPTLAYSQGVLGVITSSKIEGRYLPAPDQNQAMMVSVPDDETAQYVAQQVKEKFPGMLVKLETISGEMMRLLVDYCGGDDFAGFRQWRGNMEKAGHNGNDERVIMLQLATKGDATKFADEFQAFAVTELKDRAGNDLSERVYYDDAKTISDIRHDCTGASNRAIVKLGVSDENDSPKYRWSPDIAVPPDRMAEFLHETSAAIKAKFSDDVFIPDFGHFERGGSHYHVISTSKDKPLDKTELAKIVIEKLRKYGGTISAEHGGGVTKPIIDGLNSLFPTELSAMAEMVRNKNPYLVLNPRSFGMDKRIEKPGKKGADIDGGANGHKKAAELS